MPEAISFFDCTNHTGSSRYYHKYLYREPIAHALIRYYYNLYTGFTGSSKLVCVKHELNRTLVFTTF